MLKKVHRLSASKDIQTTFLRGRSFFTPYFVVKYSSGPTPRFSVIVSTKVSKLAVERNRIKRIVRDYIRHTLPSLKAGDYIVVAKASSRHQSPEELRQSLNHLLTKVKLKQVR